MGANMAIDNTSESPIGAAQNVQGHATVTRADGTVDVIAEGTPIYQGDVVETDAQGAVNIVFIDETSLAVSANAHLSIDDYTFDPQTENGSTHISILRGIFVFTSGLIGRDDPDDVQINTPVGSIGIRGTIIAGDIKPNGESQITVLEGAIVVKNGAMESTLSSQFETVKLSGFDAPMKEVGVLTAQDIGAKFNVISSVLPALFSTINDAVKEQGGPNNAPDGQAPADTAPKSDAPAETHGQNTPGDIHGLMENPLSGNSQAGLPSAQAPEAASLATSPTRADSSRPLAQDTRSYDRSSGLKTFDNPSAEVIAKKAAERGNDTTPPYPHTEPVVLNLDNHNYMQARFAIINGDGSHHIGASVSILADINGDGSDDFLVLTDENSIYTMDGSGNFFSSTSLTSLSSLSETIPSTNTTVTPQNSTLISIGDFDGDGVKDYIVGQPNNVDTISGNSGTAFILSGGTSDEMRLTGSTNSSNFGSSVSGISDLNNDGYADVIIGASAESKIYLVNGGVDWSTSDVSDLSDTGNFGISVTGLGDFNGDGYSDFAVANSAANSGKGSVYIYSGGQFGPSLLGSATGTADSLGFGKEIFSLNDFNGDGRTDFYAGTDNNQMFLILGPTNAEMVKLSIPSQTILGVGALGDWNGDGYDDMAVVLHDGTQAGIYVVYGKTTTDLNADMATASDAAYLSNPDNAFHITSGVISQTEKITVSGIGDINGDGYDDMALGNASDNNITILYGRDTDAVTTGSTATGNHQSLVGSSIANILSDGGYTGISLRGGGGIDTIKITNANFLSIDGGAGHDTLKLSGGNGSSLDFGNIDFEKISGIEELSFGGNNQTMTLTFENLFNLLKSSDTGELHIEAGSGLSILNIDNNNGFTEDITAPTAAKSEISDGLNGASVDTTDSEYTKYEIGGYSLYIDTAVEVHVK